MQGSWTAYDRDRREKERGKMKPKKENNEAQSIESG
jgi:hypothetical protein